MSSGISVRFAPYFKPLKLQKRDLIRPIKSLRLSAPTLILVWLK